MTRITSVACFLALCALGEANAASLPNLRTIAASDSGHTQNQHCPWWRFARNWNGCATKRVHTSSTTSNLNTGHSWNAYVKFDFPKFEPTRRAILRINAASKPSSGRFPVYVAANNWRHQTLTGENRPARKEFVCHIHVASANSAASCDITEWFNRHADHAQTVSFHIHADHGSFKSSFAAGAGPIIIYDPTDLWHIPDAFTALPLDDMWVKKGRQSVYASQPRLLLTKKGSMASFLKFQIPDFGIAPGAAKLRLAVDNMRNNVDVYMLDSHLARWNKDTVWSSAPLGGAANATKVCTLERTSSHAECDFTDALVQVEAKRDYGDGVVELRLDSVSSAVKFMSSRTTKVADVPRLELTFRFEDQKSG